MLTRTSDLGKNISRLALKLGSLEEETTKSKRFALFG
jgi:hypothetical protein